jgi:MFS family permease
MVFIGAPFQIPGGALTDRLGRRPILLTGILGTMTLYLGIAFAPGLWFIVLVFGIEAILGWSMFLTASNAMIADLVPFERRAEAYSLTRTAVGAGAAIGPLLAARVLASGGSFRTSFVIGSAICGIFALMVVVLFKETRPRARGKSTGRAEGEQVGSAEPSCDEPSAPVAPQPAPPTECPPGELDDRPRGTYRRILRDSHFLWLLFAALAPSYCFAQIWVTLPVLLRDVHGVPPQRWALLLSAYSVSSAVLQYPVVRSLRRRDTISLIAVGSLVIGGSLTAIAFLPGGWVTVLLMLSLAVGVVLFMPLMPTVISHMAPTDLRGRYMGLWTLTYVAGYALGPLFGGRALDALGPRPAYVVAGLVGALGAALFTGLAVAVRRREGRRA